MSRGRAFAALACCALVATTTTGAAQSLGIADQQRRLVQARREAAASAMRADRLTMAAGAEKGAAAKARAQERALAGRIAAAEADLAAARARAVLIDDLLARRRAGLAAAQTPATRLLAALQSLAKRPAIVAIVQPGSVDDLVHIRAVLGTALPAMRARTAGLRAEVDASRQLRAAAITAASALRNGRAKLESARVALAQAEAAHRDRAQALGRNALSESDRALAMGERARDLVDQMEEAGTATATAAELAALEGPRPRPLAPGTPPPSRARDAYRLPVTGRLTTGLDEISAAGVRSRGLTFAVAPGSAVRAPAAGIVRYARPFRGYGAIVILDHGDGWTSLITGLGGVTVRAGDRIGVGAGIGRAAGSDDPRITIELRRRGRPVDIAALIN